MLNKAIIYKKTELSKTFNRGECLWCGEEKSNNNNSFQYKENKCECIQYTPVNKYGSVCKCGHSEIWHDRNNYLKRRIYLDSIITPLISPYINSLKNRIYELEEQTKTLITRNKRQSDVANEGYLCSVCMKSRRDTVFLPCKHAQFCNECSNKWIETNNTCPICRTQVECILDIII